MATTSSQRIEDSGEFLPGAKKHDAVKTGPQAQQGRLLEQLWPEPDWAARIAAGLPPSTAALLAVIYQGFSSNPMKDGAWGISGTAHKAFYEQCVQRMRQLFDQASTEDLKGLTSRFHQMTGVPSDIKGLSIEKLLPFYAIGRYGGRTVKSPFRLTTRTSYLSKALPDLGWPANTDAMKTGICHWQYPKTGMFGVAKFAGEGVTQLIKPQLDRHTAIHEARRLIGEALENGRKERKAIPKKGRAEDMERRGADIRCGEDVTAEQLMAKYRLRAVQFGESLSQPERQRWLNSAYDALHDLSVATGMPPAWIGLSKLGLALGARGSSGAQAHFEPGLRVINLTRQSGAGSMAHEWGHGLDNHLAIYTMEVQKFSSEKFLTQHTWALSSLKRSEPAKHAIATAMLRILCYMKTGRPDTVETGGKSEFLQAAIKIEGLKGARKSYWTTPTEMFARAFESMVQDRLATAGIYSPWLVHGTLASDLQGSAAADPYPQGEDRRMLARLIGELLQAIMGAARKPAP